MRSQTHYTLPVPPRVTQLLLDSSLLLVLATGVPGQEVRKMDNAPFDLPAVHIFKIWGGQIHEIEALGFVAPYNSPTGWEG